jgi:uncharacterized protein YbjQ (UPF0145 family)
MPDRPLWYTRLEAAIRELERLPYPWVDRQALETVLGIGRRRAQQILAPLVRHTIGKSGLAPRQDVIGHLRRLAAGEPAHYENRRRERFRAALERMYQEALERPRVLVEAPASITRQEFEDLPDGVRLGPGEISVRFRDKEEALQRLLALAMAIGNDPDGFERRISLP